MKKNYEPCELNPGLYSQMPNVRKFDLAKDIEEIEAGRYDLVLHSHVLEHIPCNIAHSLLHIHRIRKPGGIHACIIPVSPGRWDQSFEPTLSEDEKTRRLGKHDHMRRIGKKDATSTIGKIVNVANYIDFDATADFSRETLMLYNILDNHWYGLITGTSLLLGKQDYLLK
ncbi:MAG: methyltransferase domain-containing protein [Halioglobus sp.]